ncbi:MAG: PIN domain-containing protein [Clostridia bacterium]|nr:PIN domain-containing protein [Clostridia bacterium]
MKVLADSNVFIDFWKKPTQKIIDTFASEDVVVCGVVKAELLHGAKTQENYNKINGLLGEFESLALDESDWSKLGELLYSLKTKGITVPFQDAVIALIAIKYRVPLWSNDNHFHYIQRVLTELQLY